MSKMRAHCVKTDAFHEIYAFVGESHTERRENPTDTLVAGVMSRRDGRTDGRT